MSTIDPHTPALDLPANPALPGDVVVHVVPLRLSDLSTNALEAWDRLAARAADPNPFFRREFVQAASTSYGKDPLLLVGATGSEWIFCLPVDPVPRWRRLAVPCLAPWMPDVTYLSNPLVDADYVEEAGRALAAFVATERETAALILDPIDPDDASGAALTDAFVMAGHEPVRYAEWQRGALHRRAEPTYVEEAMSAKRRKELRRLRRALGRDLGGEVELVDRSDDPSACDEFLRLEGAGWKGSEGTALLSNPATAAFFRAMGESAMAAGRFQILGLECAGRTIAMQCNLIDRGTLFGFKVAYDDEFARYSPGSLLEVDAIGLFHETGLAAADSCAAGDSEMINRIWPDRRRMQTLIVPTASRRAALIEPNLAAEAFARRVARGARARWGRAPKS